MDKLVFPCQVCTPGHIHLYLSTLTTACGHPCMSATSVHTWTSTPVLVHSDSCLWTSLYVNIQSPHLDFYTCTCPEWQLSVNIPVCQHPESTPGRLHLYIPDWQHLVSTPRYIHTCTWQLYLWAVLSSQVKFWHLNICTCIYLLWQITCGHHFQRPVSTPEHVNLHLPTPTTLPVHIMGGLVDEKLQTYRPRSSLRPAYPSEFVQKLTSSTDVHAYFSKYGLWSRTALADVNNINRQSVIVC